MVARGDLGMEIPPEKVFIAQKWMIEKANIAAKPVITATQMLESMIKAPRPTRAEASDVANAVLDGTDAVMLSGESANGSYPINAVTIMGRCAAEAERCLNYAKVLAEIKLNTTSPITQSEALAASAAGTVQDLGVGLIIVLTETGRMARLVSKYRPNAQIVAASTNDVVLNNMNTSRGVTGLKIDSYAGTDGLVASTIAQAKAAGLASAGSKVIAITGVQENTPDETALLKIIDVE